MLDGRKFFDHPVKNDMVVSEFIQKIDTGRGDDYITGCLLDYPYYKENYKLIAIELSKRQALDAARQVIQQINFTDNLEQAGNIAFLMKQCFSFLSK